MIVIYKMGRNSNTQQLFTLVFNDRKIPIWISDLSALQPTFAWILHFVFADQRDSTAEFQNLKYR